MSRANAALVGVAVWLVSLAGAMSLPDDSTKAVVVFGAASAVITATTIVVARALCRALTKAVLKQ